MRDLDRQRRVNSSALRVILAAAAVIAIALLAWNTVQVLLLAFGSVVVAAVLVSGANLLAFLPLDHRWRVALAAAAAVAVFAGAGVLLGNQVKDQLAGLAVQLPDMIDTLGRYVGILDLWDRLTEYAERLILRTDAPRNIAGYTSGLVGAVGGLALVLVGGVYLAWAPGLYKRGLVALFPPELRARFADALDRCGEALQHWMLGQLLTMVVVGVATTIGLTIIGVPSAVALGIVAGLFEFIPFVGPILAVVPAVVVAASEGGTMVFWVAGLYLLVQQLENNLIVPVVQQRTVHLPPALGLFSLLAMGIVFGPLGVLLGTPLTVVLMVAVRELWIEPNGGMEPRPPDTSLERHETR
ncbi:AI-2E family transporter [Devosia geojensis]|uniref:AI-2E family transporter n=1 Tax=Devosia geojensis TaxID=443610 RepID=UPI0006987C99|nr:AI-2E family transporter [Devosia geojensis]